MREMPRVWKVKKQGTQGWGLHVQDERGNRAQVESMNAEAGDPIESCRYYFAEFSQWMDILYEPDRVYVKMSWGIC